MTGEIRTGSGLINDLWMPEFSIIKYFKGSRAFCKNRFCLVADMFFFKHTYMLKRSKYKYIYLFDFREKYIYIYY